MTKKLCCMLVALFTSVLLIPRNVIAQHYEQTNLVSDVSDLAAVTDPDLQNAWGLARSATSPWWVADNGTGKSTLYHADGSKQALVVTVPPATGSTPTGVVFHSGAGFLVPGTTTSAMFIFATEDGTVSAWGGGSSAVLTPINHPGSAIYKGVTLGMVGATQILYVANFKSGSVEAYGSDWNSASALVPGGFVDNELPAGYAPFNVQNVGGDIFVMWAKQGEPPDEVDGRGLGYVDKFDSAGHLLMRFQHGPWLNAPWGVALAPADFGLFSNDILVGNFGSGEIAAFDPGSGEFLGRVHGPKGTLVIDGLWALKFGGGTNTTNDGFANELFFTAGIDDEQHGLFGKLTASAKGSGGDNGQGKEKGQD